MKKSEGNIDSSDKWDDETVSESESGSPKK
jgi:hypothetical protein